ncbi:hypothetical protein TRE132_01450 [Pseudomonas chlororaphis subsp. aurantiaca]|nr:hypothetical protein TRE132_01450 [Pseudomonas chlororaphis subsp. aurantiaca]
MNFAGADSRGSPPAAQALADKRTGACFQLSVSRGAVIVRCHCLLADQPAPSFDPRQLPWTLRIGGTFSSFSDPALAVFGAAAGRLAAGRPAGRLGFFPDQPPRHGAVRAAGRRAEAHRRLAAVAGDPEPGQRDGAAQGGQPVLQQEHALRGRHRPVASGGLLGTPVEALWKGAGDCEDYAIAKYFSLRHLGVSSDKLRITYVKALRQNRAHMVLTYYSTRKPCRWSSTA